MHFKTLKVLNAKMRKVIKVQYILPSFLLSSGSMKYLNSRPIEGKKLVQNTILFLEMIKLKCDLIRCCLN